MKSSHRLVLPSNNLLPLIHEWFNSRVAHGEFDEPVMMEMDRLQRRFDQGYLQSLRVILLNEEPIGWTDVSTFPDSLESGRITVQISKPEFRGRGFGKEIHKLALSDFLGANLNVRWVEAWTHVHNMAEQKILEGLGFKKDTATKKFPVNGQEADFFAYELEVKL